MAGIIDILQSLLSGQGSAQPATFGQAPAPAMAQMPLPNQQRPPGGIPFPSPKPQGMGQSMPMPSLAPAPQPASAGAFGNIGSGIGDIMSGMASVDPNAAGLSSFAQGFSGNRNARKSREDEKLAKSQAALSADDARRQQSFENQLKTDEARRKAASDKFSNLKTAADIEKLQTEADKNGLTVAEYGKLETRLNGFREVLAGKYGRLMVDGEDSGGIQDAIETLVDAERQRQIAEMKKLGTSDGSVAPEGTEQNPHMPTSATDLKRIPTGAIYRNPADGGLYRKK